MRTVIRQLKLKWVSIPLGPREAMKETIDALRLAIEAGEVVQDAKIFFIDVPDGVPRSESGVFFMGFPIVIDDLAYAVSGLSAAVDFGISIERVCHCCCTSSAFPFQMGLKVSAADQQGETSIAFMEIVMRDGRSHIGDVQQVSCPGHPGAPS